MREGIPVLWDSFFDIKKDLRRKGRNRRKEHRMRELTRGNISKCILLFTLPVFIGNLFNLAYSLADTRIIGSYLGHETLAAVGSVSTLSDFLISFIIGLANGFAVVTARYFGMGDREKVRKCFAVSLFLGGIITFLLIAVSLIGMDGIFSFLHVAKEQEKEAAEYIIVIIYGMIFSIFYNVLAANLRAIGDAYTPLLFLILSAVLNIGLDLLCVGTFHMGVKGAAIATVISQMFSLLLCFVYIWRKYEFLRFGFSDFKWDGYLSKQLLPAGFSMGLMTCLVAFGTLALQTAINKLGTDIIVAHAATRKLTNMYMVPFAALGTTIATFSGQNYGAGKVERIKKGLKSTLLMSYVWCAVVVWISYTICPRLIVAITDTHNTKVIETACLYQRVDTLFYLLVPTITILRNSLQGIGDHTTPIISSGLELVGKVAIAMLLSPILEYWAIIWAEPIIWSIMVIPLIISMVKRLRRMSQIAE